MLNAHSFDELAARIGKAIENSPAKDVEKNVKAMLASGLSRLDLVSRAEFDVQTEVLRKTREKLEALVASVPEPKKLVVIEGGDHFFEGRLREMREAMEAWIKETVSSQPSAFS